MIDKEFFGNYSIANSKPVYEVAGRVTIRGDSNVQWHIDFIDNSVSLKFRRVDAVTALIDDLMRLRDEMLRKEGENMNDA
jgi:hypothetical protein